MSSAVDGGDAPLPLVRYLLSAGVLSLALPAHRARGKGTYAGCITACARFATPGPQYAFTAKQTPNMGQFRSTLYQNPTFAALEFWLSTGAMSGSSDSSSSEIRLTVVTLRTRVRSSGSLVSETSS